MKLLFPLSIYKIQGNSMEPYLKNGDYVVIWKTKKVKKGNVVLVQNPNSKILIVKRVKKIEKNLIELRGDNLAQSTDSRSFGPLPISKVKGKVIFRIK